ncbi:MAG: B12-binding domain-containing radical SAM protein [Chloroflexi bacterium]|nr:B12-binding domain-containing radical SAM protein [Chloroflexota bacterium]
MVEPLGLEFLAGAIDDLVDVSIIDMRIEQNLEQRLSATQAGIVGVTCGYTADVPVVRNVVRRVKRYNPEIVVIVGGHHASLSPEDFFISEIDYIVCGEGEQAFRDLILAIAESNRDKIRQIPRLYFQENGQHILTWDEEKHRFHVNKEPTAEMTQRPRPRRDLVNSYRSHYYFLYYKNPWTVESARGCAFRCNFCSVWKFHRGDYKTEEAARTIEEIRGVEGRYVPFVDDLAFRQPQVARDLARGLIAEGVNKRYWAQCRASDIVAHPESFQALAEAGLDMVLMGIEAIDQETLKKLNKGSKPTMNIEAIKILHDAGVKIWGALIVDPDWREEDFDRLAEFVNHYDIECPQFTILTPLPGTELYKTVEGQLMSKDYRHFDFLHTVLPTRLPIEKFYERYAQLYQQTGMKMNGIMQLLRDRIVTIDDLRHFKEKFQELINPEIYLRSLNLEPVS